MAKKILLADDSVTIQKVVELILSEGDYELKVFSNGQDALQYIQKEKPDLVLADIEMPGLNGYELCEKIKSNPSLQDIPVILLSGAFEPLDEDRASQVKADGNLVKPFESSELISKINEALSRAPETEQPVEDVYEISEEEIASLEKTEEEFEVTEEGVSAETEEVIIEEGPEEDLWETEFSGTEEEFAEISVTEEEPSEGLPEPEVEETFEETKTEEQPSEFESPQVESSYPEEQPAEALTETPSISISTEQIEKSIQEGIERVFQKIDSSVKSMLQESMANINIGENINNIIQNQLSQHLERLILEKLPPAIEEGIKNTVESLSGELKTEIERILWETVPDLAETIITKEIEKIKAKY